MTFQIRPFEDDDEAAVVALWQRCGLTRPWNDPAKDIRRKLAEQPELFGVMVEGGVIVGTVMAGYAGPRGWLHSLTIDPSRQQRGLGRQLVDWSEARLRERGCPKINLQIRQDNDAVLAFYAALGYANDNVVSLGKRLEHDHP